MSGEVDANATSEDGKTTLTVALLHRNMSALQLIIRHGGEVNQTSHVHYHRDHISPGISSYDESPLLTAARLNYTNMVLVLLENGAAVNLQNECRPQQGVDKFKDRTALHFAAESGNVEMVKVLLEYGAKVNIADKQQELPLHLAVRCKISSCKELSEVISLLIQYGTQVDAVSKIGCTPLYLASFYGCVHKAKILIESGADVNYSCERDNSFVTALHIAASKDRLALAQILVENNAKLDTYNTLRYTPLQLNINAQSKSDVASLLVYHGADLTGRDRFGFTLMASIIRNMRIDCEILAQLLVFAGYDLNPDTWLLDENSRSEWSTADPNDNSSDESTSEEDAESRTMDVPIPQGRVERLCDWLRERQQNPASLLESCRFTVRSHLGAQVSQGSSIVRYISELPLPTPVIQYLLLKDVYIYS